MVRHRLLTARNLLLALPPLAVTLGLAIVAGMEMAGSHPLTLGPPRSVAEAIAMRDGASAARLFETAPQANEIEMIRSGILLDRVVLATPLEAAVIVDEASMLEFLVSRGAELPHERLACLAVDVGARAVLSRLGDASTCRAGEAWAAVLSRP